MNRKIAAAFTVVALLSGTDPQAAFAGGIPLGLPAQEPTQLLNHVELVSQYVQLGIQYETQLKQYAEQIKQGQLSLTQAYGPIQSDLLGLQRIVQGGNALSYAMGNLDSQFMAKFASLGYAPPNGTTYSQRYATWSQTAMDTTRKTLDAAGLQNTQMQSELGLAQELQQESQSAAGEMQALQVGNQIATEEVDQLIKLRQLMQADITSKAVFQAKQISEDDEANRAAGFFASQDMYQSY